MATYISKATGNFTAAGTWSPISAVSAAESDSEAGNTTSTTSFVYSATFTLAAVAHDGVAIKVASRIASPSGTVTITLANNTNPGSNEGTLTINVSDIDASGLGWYFFKFGSSVTPNGTDAYKIGFKSSVGGEINLFRTSTAGDWSRMVRLTSSASAPTTSDKLMMMGEWTAAATLTSFTITLDDTSATVYGPTVSGGPPQGMTVCKGATFTFGTSASTNYTLYWKGILGVYGGATMSVGTSGTPIPSTSTAVLQMNSVANVDSGLVINNGATFNAYGASKTSIWTYLTADASGGATSLTVGSTSGWVASDVLIITTTDQTNTHTETTTISSVTDGTHVAVGAITNAHSGTSPTQAEVGNLTRNVKIRGISTSLQGYLTSGTTSTTNIQYVELYQLGSSTNAKIGITLTVTTGLFSMQFCALHDFAVSGSSMLLIISSATLPAAASNLVINNNVFYSPSTNFSGGILLNNFGIIAPYTFTNNLATGVNLTVQLVAGGGTICTGNNIVGTMSFSGQGGFGAGGSWSSNVIHCATLTLSNLQNSAVFGTTSIYRAPATGLTLNGGNNTTLNNFTIFGCLSQNISFGTTCYNILFNNLISGGDTTFSTPYAFQTTSITIYGPGIILENCSISQVSGIITAHTTADMNFNLAGAPSLNASVCQFLSRNSLHGSTLANNVSKLGPGSYIAFQSLNQTPGNHKTLMPYGIISIDVVIYDVSPSERLTPNSANKLQSGLFQASVDSGHTLTPSVKVRQSVVGDGTAYTGNFPRLIVLKNVAAGIAADTVLATGSVAGQGAWETLSAATISVTDDAVLTFVVDCDGSNGWVNVDTITVI